MPYAYAVIEKGTRAVKLVTLDETLANDTAEMLAAGGDYIVAGKDCTDQEYENLQKLVAGNATMGKLKGEILQ